MMKQLTASILFFLALPTQSAEACVGCVNSATEVRLPFLGSLLGVFAVWLILSLVFDRPLSTGLKRFLFLGMPFLVLVVLMIVPLILGLPLLLCWLGYLLRRIIQLRSMKREGKSIPLISSGVNLLALTLSLTLIIVSSTRANSTPGLIASLGRVSPHFPGNVQHQMTRVIQRGPAVIAPLSTALEQGLDREYISPFRTAQIAYCLSQLGGDQAEAALQQAIEQHITFDDDFYGKWETAVCCLYAESARERAVPTLMNLLNTAEEKQAPAQKLIALLALARTQDPAAVNAVLDQVSFLEEPEQNNKILNWQSRLTRLTLQALAEGQEPADLSASPIYEPLRLGLQTDSRTNTGIEWDEHWHGKLDTDALKEHWSALLKAKD